MAITTGNGRLVLILIGIFLLSLSILVFELSLIRLFSVVITPGFSFLGISIVFFGLAFGGLIVYLFPRFFDNQSWVVKFLYSILAYGLTAVLLVFIFPFLNFYNLTRDIILFSLVLFIISVPFTLANICFSLIFKFRSKDIKSLYFSDLLGAGIGVVAAVFLMNFLSPFSLILTASAMAFMALGIFSSAFGNKKMLIIAAILCLSTVILVAIDGKLGIFDIKYTKQGLEENIIFSKWNSFSRVAVKKEGSDDRMVFSMPSDKNIQHEHMGIYIDADAYTPVLKYDGNIKEVDFLKNDLSSAVYLISDKGQAMVIGSGGGRDILAALLFGQKITAVEINPIIIDDVMRGILRDFSGHVYDNSFVNVNLAEGRSFVKRDRNYYDVISLPLVDTWASTVGGHFATVENYLYTVEAFTDYLKHLNDQGALSISRWDYDGMRLISLYKLAGQNLGIPTPEKNIFIIQNGLLNNYLFKKEPFTSEEVKILTKFARENGFAVVYSPFEKGDNDYYKFLASEDIYKFAENYNKNLFPVFDDNPFFFFTIPDRYLLLLPIIPKWASTFDGGLGMTLWAVTILAFICIALPIIVERISLSRKKSRFFYPYMIYFAVLGVSFMFIEIAFIQKFILYLEQPIYSYSVVLAAALIAAGIGSVISEKVDRSKGRSILIIGSAIFIIIFGETRLLDYVVDRTMGSALALKIINSILFVAPAFVLMGTMLPAGIRKLEDAGGTEYIPWAWAVNGAFSVLAGVLAVYCGILLGFKGVLLVGGGLYILAGLVVFAIHNRRV